MTDIDWTEFFALYRPAALRFARGLAGGREEVAEDWVQEVARSMLERVGEGRLEMASLEHARNYFFRAVHNLSVTDARRRGRRGEEVAVREPVDPRAGPLEVVQGADDRRRWGEVGRALTRLPEREREAIALRFEQGLGYREMAERTGTAISTLQARVESGLRKIRGILGKPEGRA